MNGCVLAVLVIASVISSAWSAGDMTVLHSPTGVQFSSGSALKASELSNVLLAAMGRSTDSNKAWNALSITNPFGFAKTAAVIIVDGLSDLKLAGQHIPFKVNTDLDTVKDALLSKLTERGSSLTVLNEHSTTRLSDVKIQKLDPSKEVDAVFLKDIGLLYEAAAQVGAADNIWLRIRGLHGLVDFYGTQSDEVTEALELLKEALTAVENSSNKHFADEFLLVAIASDESHTRRARQILESRAGNNTFGHLNLSQRYTENYSSIFNIILWISVFLIAALISTSVFICTMDPGRDSIIYRMTTQRMKKEN